MTESTVSFFRDLFRFNRWANDQLLKGVRQLDHSTLYHPLPAGWKNVYHILVHLHATEAMALERFHGGSPERLHDAGDFVGVEDIKRQWESIDRNIMEFLESLEEADLEMRFRFRRLNDEIVEMSQLEMLLSTALHSIYHRGQIQYLLRSYGIRPEQMDPLVYFLTHAPETKIPQSILRELIGYTSWAEERTVEALQTMDADQLRCSYRGGLGSAWETQVHVVSTMGGWLERMDGEPDFRMMDATDIKDVDELNEFMTSHLREIDNITRVREDLSDRITIQSRMHSLTVSRAQLVFQLMTHAVYHRGQTMMMVRFAGGEPNSSDFVTYAQTKAIVNV